MRFFPFFLVYVGAPASTTMWGQLGSNGRQAPCEAEAPATPGCMHTAGTATSGKIHQHAVHTVLLTLACVVDLVRPCAVHML